MNESDEPKEIVTRTVIITSVLVIALLVGLIIYFIKMRGATIRINKHKIKRDEKMLSIVNNAEENRSILADKNM